MHSLQNPPTVADKQMERLPEIQRKGPGHPGLPDRTGLPDRKLLLLQVQLSFPRGRRRGRTVYTS